MAGSGKILLRNGKGDIVAQSPDELLNWYQKGSALAGDFIFDFESQKWSRLAEHAIFSRFFVSKPSATTEKRVIYFLNPGVTPEPVGPLSVREIQEKVKKQELSDSSWLLVEGDKEWRQVKSLKALAELLPALPGSPPLNSVTHPRPELHQTETTDVVLDLDGAAPAIAESSFPIEQKPDEPELVAGHASAASDFGDDSYEPTKAFSVLGLSLEEQKAEGGGISRQPGTLPPKPAVPMHHKPDALGAQNITAPNLPGRGSSPMAREEIPSEKLALESSGNAGAFDGVTAEIPTDPIWLVKQANSEAVSGPFRFLQIVKFLEQGKLTKNDKISKVGTNRFIKILQQYEFNVSYSLENVVEDGIEKQKIFIRRRHPRVPYITGVQIASKNGLIAGSCVNVSAGGILVEVPKADMALGDILDIKILPGLIPRTITCKMLLIGKIPKVPPGLAFKFEMLKPEDKEAIEHFVHEALRREMGK